MSLKQPIFGRSMYADEAITAGQLVHISGDDSVSVSTTGAQGTIGMAVQDIAQGEIGTIELFVKGIVELQADGAIVAGANVTASANGVATAQGEDNSFGVALRGGTNAPITIAVK